jgi:hypothetical protein
MEMHILEIRKSGCDTSSKTGLAYMKIKRISVNPRCHGPVEYHILWECAACGKESEFTLQFSLLVELDLPCSRCSGPNRYSLPEDYLAGLERLAEPAAELNSFAMRQVAANPSPDLFGLGSNLYFPLFAHLSNALKERENG